MHFLFYVSGIINKVVFIIICFFHCLSLTWINNYWSISLPIYQYYNFNKLLKLLLLQQFLLPGKQEKSDLIKDSSYDYGQKGRDSQFGCLIIIIHYVQYAILHPYCDFRDDVKVQRSTLRYPASRQCGIRFIIAAHLNVTA